MEIREHIFKGHFKIEHIQKGVSLIYLWVYVVAPVDNLPYSKVDFAYKISRLIWVWEKICKTYFCYQD